MSNRSGWGGGYLTGTSYLPGWYSQQSPMHLATTCLLMGVACDLPAGDEPVHYLELGCGLGFGSLVLAASNPSWQVTGIDFNPAHVALARSAARDAGLTNVTFLEADLATFYQDEQGRQLPQVDFVSLHGLWSWVTPPVRAGIVRLLAAKVRAGGVVHLSYNALPAWQGVLALQKIMVLAGGDPSAPAERRVRQGVALARQLAAAGAMHLKESPFVRQVIEKMDTMPFEYLAHEYLNDGWNPCFHADVAEALSAAKLDWVGSASLPENFATLMLTEAQRAVHAQSDDPRLRELIKDSCLPRGLRHDVFIRGAQGLRPAVRDEALRDLVMALATPPDGLDYQVELPSGIASISADFYAPMIAAMAREPRSVGELLSLAATGGRDDPRELVGMLVGAGYAVPVARRGLPPHPAAVRLNRLASRWLSHPDTLQRPLAAASVALGGGFPATAIDLFVQDRLHSGESASALDRWAEGLAGGAPEASKAALRDTLAHSLDARIPLMRAAGVL